MRIVDFTYKQRIRSCSSAAKVPLPPVHPAHVCAIARPIIIPRTRPCPTESGAHTNSPLADSVAKLLSLSLRRWQEAY